MCQSAKSKQSRDDFKDVHGLEDLSLKIFPEEILRQYIFRSVLFIVYKHASTVLYLWTSEN